MDSFIPQAIETVTKAIEADNEGEYEKALGLYRDALGRFTMGLKYEKNEARKKLIMERVEGYLKRAEELKDFVAKQNELDKNGGGGSATKKAGDKEEDEDAEKKKLRGALAWLLQLPAILGKLLHLLFFAYMYCLYFCTPVLFFVY